ncbi:MAG: hypothetical protein K0S47_993 [Herbinix sp.]|nr:hypothetical protein [Herbinix sp.]
MNKKFPNGIIINELVHMDFRKKAVITWYEKVLQFFAILLGTWSVSLCMIEGFEIPVIINYIHWAVISSVTLFALLAYWHSFDKTKLFLISFMSISLIYIYRKALINGFYHLENLSISKVNRYYNMHIAGYIADYDTMNFDTTIVLILIVVIIAGLLTMAVIRNKLKYFCYIAVLLSYTLSFAVGIIPRERYFIASLLVIIFLATANASGQQAVSKEQSAFVQRIHSKTAIILCAVCILLLLLLRVVVTPKQYESFTPVKDAKTTIQTKLLDFTVYDLVNKINNMGLVLFESKNRASGGLSGGKLGRFDYVSFDHTEQLSLTLPLVSITDGLYLKGYVGSVYTGDSWDGPSDETKLLYSEMKDDTFPNLEPINQTVDLFNHLGELSIRSRPEVSVPASRSDSPYQVYKGKIIVEYTDANKAFLYTPYYTDFTTEDHILYVEDLYAAPKKKEDKYEYDYYYNISMMDQFGALWDTGQDKVLEEYKEEEKAYRDYVYDTYTKLPEEGIDRLIREFGSKIEPTTENVQNQIILIKNYLKENTEYSLSPGRLPEGKDFVEYFLYETKRGYCTHFASAATLMLRAMGIPARYVEGYSVGYEDADMDNQLPDQTVERITKMNIYENSIRQVKVSVKDSDAHAWVEVYFDGAGWIPVEFTPGSQNFEEASPVEDLLLPRNDNTQENPKPTKAPTSAPTTSPTPTVIQEKPKDEQINEKEAAMNKPSKENSNNNPDHLSRSQDSGIIFYIKYVAILLFLTGIVLLLRFAFIKYKKSKEKRFKNLSKRALFLYDDTVKVLKSCHALKEHYRVEDTIAYAESHCPYIKQGTFSPFMEHILKARFSKHRLNTEEFRQVEDFYKRLIKKAYRESSFLQKIYFKLILVI